MSEIQVTKKYGALPTEGNPSSKLGAAGVAPKSEDLPQVAYFTTKDFDKALSKAYLSGAQAQKRAIKVKAVLGSLSDSNPFVSVPVTNHGESRIKNAVKYDLGDGWRLVTQQTDKFCTFLFVGDHDETDRWLDRNRGLTAGVKDQRPVLVPGTGVRIAQRIQYWADHHDQALVDRLEAEGMDYVLQDLPRSTARRLEALDARATAAEVEAITQSIGDVAKADLVKSVFSLLLSGDYLGAQAHIDLSMGRIEPIENVDPDSMIDVADGENIRRLKIGSLEYEAWLSAFEKRSQWFEWFLYLHPEQEKVVLADYPGVAQLSGVSGSGKTCVAVRRALRLAENPDSKVLLLTLNRSLAGLLRQLVDAAATEEGFRRRIEVTSFFELAQTLLHEFEPHNDKLYADVSWKLGEHVDLVFREFYRQWLNNPAAKCLIPLHKTLNARGVSGEAYVREEFDWIRSAVSAGEREKYLTLDRKGRRFPIPSDRRADLLEGLLGWEEKMRDVGVIDYLGLSASLAKHLPNIGARYTNVLLDEAQDFGTTELKVIRRLVPVGRNDIFLCGDIAQTILPKHRSLSEAGFSSVSRDRIRQNYRNSREILKAAYQVLSNNLHEELFDSSDLEILDPKFANFSGNVPMALGSESLEEEIAFARSYADTILQTSTSKSVCIAFAGFSTRDIKSYAEFCGEAALDGGYDPRSDRLVFCDLEQTKGYEFDTLIIVNCREGVLPPSDAPLEEAYRASCRLYVAMTRARRELILSFSGEASHWIADVSDTIGTAAWSDVEQLNPAHLKGTPAVLPEIEPDREITDVGQLDGRQFLYTKGALGLSPEAQDKLVERVDGRGLRAAGRGQLKWRTISLLTTDLSASRRQDSLFGSQVVAELRRVLLSSDQ